MSATIDKCWLIEFLNDYFKTNKYTIEPYMRCSEIDKEDYILYYGLFLGDAKVTFFNGAIDVSYTSPPHPVLITKWKNGTNPHQFIGYRITFETSIK